jgi:hypothetical protein
MNGTNVPPAGLPKTTDYWKSWNKFIKFYCATQKFQNWLSCIYFTYINVYCEYLSINSIFWASFHCIYKKASIVFRHLFLNTSFRTFSCSPFNVRMSSLHVVFSAHLWHVLMSSCCILWIIDGVLGSCSFSLLPSMEYLTLAHSRCCHLLAHCLLCLHLAWFEDFPPHLQLDSYVSNYWTWWAFFTQFGHCFLEIRS